jgi:hypothetical protein
VSSIRTAFTRSDSAAGAARELQERLGAPPPRLVLYFATAAQDPAALAAAMEAAFAPAAVIGCTSAGELASGAMLQGAVVAMALGPDVVGDVAVEVLEGVRAGGGDLVPAAFEGLGRKLGAPMRRLDPSRHVGLVLVDGLSGAEERLMDAVGSGTDVLFVGGSAGDDLAFRATHVFAGGKAIPDAALLAVLRLERGFSILKTQSFATTGKRLVATQVDEASRTVHAFDGRPAAQAYAAALGVAPEGLPALFASHPLGLMAGDEPFVRSPQRVVGGAVKFYCAIAEGAELEILRSTDIVEETRLALERKRKMLGGISGLVNFNCILRTLELQKNGQTAAYGALFADVPTVGFSTYGEEYLGHVNQTATMLVLR